MSPGTSPPPLINAIHGSNASDQDIPNWRGVKRPSPLVQKKPMEYAYSWNLRLHNARLAGAAENPYLVRQSEKPESIVRDDRN
jgi:hypothetical protein